MSQFTCEICGDGFEQKSRFERHMATSHPERAPSAADIEKVLAGIRYPKTREELVDHASQNVSDKDLMSLVKSLPSRTYRDSAEVAIALGEVKRGQGVRSAEETAKTEAPSTKHKGRKGGSYRSIFSRSTGEGSVWNRLSKEKGRLEGLRPEACT